MDKKLILVVEDEKVVRELLVKELTQRAYDTIEAEDGEKALQVWQDKKPDLVLLDILLPKMDGFQIMKAVRAHPDPKVGQALVLVLSNLWEKDKIEEMNKFKVSDYLVKANNTVADVIARIDKLFETK